MTRKSVALLSSAFLLGLLAGCGNPDGIDVNSDGSMDVETEEGSARIGTQSMPADWPEDVPSYPGATVSYSASMNPQTGKPGMAVVLASTDAIAKVAAYYKTELASRGWTVDTAMEATGTSIFSAKKDDRTISLLIAEADGQTTITMAIETGEAEE